MNAWQKYHYCFLAGLCAASGSFFGKMPSVLKSSKFYVDHISLLTTSWQTYAAAVLFQGLPIVLMISSNIMNWRYFLKALQLSEQTLTATVLTAASNYVVSFLLGSLVLKEPLSLLSILGSTFIVLGLWFLCGETQGQMKAKKQ